MKKRLLEKGTPLQRVRYLLDITAGTGKKAGGKDVLAQARQILLSELPGVLQQLERSHSFKELSEVLAGAGRHEEAGVYAVKARNWKAAHRYFTAAKAHYSGAVKFLEASQPQRAYNLLKLGKLREEGAKLLEERGEFKYAALLRSKRGK